MELKHLAQALEKTEKELQEERATTLSRTGEKLEQLIEQLQTLRGRLSAMAPAERRAHVETYRRLHKDAHYQLWCLVVNREALGLRQHAELDDHYPIPPKWP
jgi:DNA repair exonuclease SbcCD ATPase subunit